jgi:manganese oxidase
MNYDPNKATDDRPEIAREWSELYSTMAVVLAGVAAVAAFVAVIWTVGDRGTGATTSGESTVKVTLSDFKVTLDRSSVPPGPVILVVKNDAATGHNLRIKGLPGTRNLKKGESQTLNLGSLEAGDYELVCEVPGHKDLGMKTTLTVTGAAIGDGAPALAAATGADATADWKVVDAAHEKVVKDFLAGPPAKTEGIGNQPSVPKMENGIAVHELTAKVVQWEVAPGVRYEAWTYNGTVPGPEIRMKQGETVKVRLKNELPESTSIHFHGLEVADNKQDGVTFVTQDPIIPGATYEYTLTPVNCGSHMFHSHHSADAQVPLGLLGSFVVECTTTPVPAFAAHTTEYTEILTDGPLGFGINGKGFPATAPVVSKVGEKTLVRFLNEGLIIHPMHLHGHPMMVVAKDGNFLPAPQMVDTLNIAPGERYDVIVESKYPGAWAFHCHILTHAESPQGLHGMTTVWVVQPA